MLGIRVRARLNGRSKWARRCQQRDGILAVIDHGLSNARIEQINT
jgi:transposase